MAHKPQQLPGYTRLNQGVWFRDSRSPQRAKLFVLCTWMGAALKHIAKYTSEYQSLEPDAQILIVQSNFEDVMWRSRETQRRRMAPARQVIRAAESASSGIRMHVFSNGGVLSATQLMLQYRSEFGKTISLKSLVIDSAPGKPRFDSAINALSQLAPRSGFRRFISIFLAYISFTLIWLYIKGLRREFMVARIRRELNSPELFNRGVPRTYIYSRADKLIDWSEVKEHAEAARDVGYVVNEEVFESSSHVAHALQDRPRYWKIIDSVSRQ